VNASAPFRVLHLRTVRGTGGGPDKTVLNSCRDLIARGHTARGFYILDRHGDTGRLQAHAQALGVPVISAMEDSALCPATVRALHAELRRGRYDVVHTHEYKSNALAHLLRPFHSFLVVATAHGYNPTSRRELFYYGLDRLLLRYASAVIAPNRAMFDLLRRLGVAPGRLQVIPNGILTRGRTPPEHVPGERVRLLVLGRLSAEKDPANAVEALGQLLQRGLDVELTLAGDGPERPALEQLADRSGLAGRVRLAGFVPDVMPLLANADILISPSRTECMPNALLEAMWARLPVAATDVGGVGEMVRDGVDALLCAPRSPGALADAVSRLARDPDLARRLAENAHRRLLSEFTFERRMEHVAALYRRLLHRKGLRRTQRPT